MDCATVRPHFHDPYDTHSIYAHNHEIPYNETLRPSRQYLDTPGPYSANPMNGIRYAYPIRTCNTQHNGMNNGGKTQEAVLAETMLRRKTPNGTLNGAYQGSLHDVNPMKHMLMPGYQSGNTAHTLHPPSRMDSALNQGLASPIPLYDLLGQAPATAIQPPGQPFGPTASGIIGRGPYGPFWPDGTFVPYRPSALRDPRLYQAWNVPGVHAHLYSPSASGVYAPYQPSLHWQSNSHPATPATSQGPFGVSSAPQASYFPPTTPPIDPLQDFSPTSANAQQREKIFNLALKTYRQLLGYLTQTRNQSQHHQLSHGVQPQNRSHIYPKPPSSSTGHAPPAPSQEIVPTHHLSTDQGYSEMHRGKRDSLTPTLYDLPQLFNDLADQDGHSTLRKHSASYQQPAWPYPQPDIADNIKTLRRSAGSIMASSLSPFPHSDLPVARARIALSSLFKLCSQTAWQWIDGINLSGCLAHGLGDHQKALELYNRVLILDPRHLEATANRAASLLMLGRKQEAEQNWVKVIKQAPSHFEAVEHLVGLLCSSQRAKEAVKVIDFVERTLKIEKKDERLRVGDHQSETSSSASRSPCISDVSDLMHFDYEAEEAHSRGSRDATCLNEPGFGSSGYAIAGHDNGRLLTLIHSKGNMMYSSGDNAGAARAFEEAVLMAAGRKYKSIKAMVQHVLSMIAEPLPRSEQYIDPVLLDPSQAVQTARLCFPHDGELPGLRWVGGDSPSFAKKSATMTTSNSLLSLAKIFQDNMSNAARADLGQAISGTREILALYYLSLSLQPSPSTANNVGILLAGVQQSAPVSRGLAQFRNSKPILPGVQPNTGTGLAVAYYNYGLSIDSRHAHLYTNLGSLLKDIGQLDAAIEMYKNAVQCDGRFDIALANLANAVKDKGRVSEAIDYYNRAVKVNPDFAEAVCGLANALNSVCGWTSRGGVAYDGGKRDRWHVDDEGMLLDATIPGATSTGWIKRVMDIVEKQLREGEDWGLGTLTPTVIDDMVQQMGKQERLPVALSEGESFLRKTLATWAGQKFEGAKVVRLIERSNRRISWQWYQDKFVRKRERSLLSYKRSQLPSRVSIPPAPTVLPFHTFTTPMSAKQVRSISQRNGHRVSASTLRAPWLPAQVYPPPAPPNPVIRVGYVSSDFNNHPLAHLMQSVFGLHDLNRVKAYCYATTASDNSVHRQQIENESPHFYDATTWSTEQLVNKIVEDGIHILVNLNGYTRGARNEVFAARPAPVQMSFMGFAGTLGAEWCDYVLADTTAVPTNTLRPWRRNVDLEDQVVDENSDGENEDWVYGENIIFSRDTFFCCDHRQSAPDSGEERLSWEDEQKRRWKMRKEIFPRLADDAIIFGNFNQLYKIDPTTFRTWLRILSRVPNSILWLLRFPDLGEANLLRTARQWAGMEVASRVIFTDVAPKQQHISRARVCDLFLDTPECNAHTTAADILWSGTPLLTLPRHEYKMCSRMAASILKGALPKHPAAGRIQAEKDLIASSEEQYEELAIKLGNGLRYPKTGQGKEGHGHGRLMELRKMLTESRWTSALFDTKRWVSDLEDAFEECWRRWAAGEGGDIWLDEVPRSKRG